MRDWPARLAAACDHSHVGDLAERDARRGAPAAMLKHAAVLIGIRDTPEPTIILTQRSTALRHHPGQISFPGGRIEAFDASPQDAACREAFEEIGLARQAIDILGELPDYTTVTGFSIRPVVARVAAEAVIAADGVEASQLIELPLARALYGPAYRFQRIERNGQTYRIYSIDHAGHHVWGATASMLVTLARASAALEARSFTIATEAEIG
ncbi:CoA pyrophosphatase [Salinisphaera japonica]|uniref:NUDIX hydrolase n=1 Tax=Salinisphaera japonica YTM-1 TaxID=1209778 RepID=A0A423Q2G1_9GAMM|nr:CoA pyrophosphatase [Salinisphaera japonica]ROO32708.1 NUDIX hydrolase [Salinisphaera japonica YTM-1]